MSSTAGPTGARLGELVVTEGSDEPVTMIQYRITDE